MKFNNLLSLSFLIALTMLSGCSDLFGKKVVKNALQSTQFTANCDLDIDKFSQIMYERIPEPIKCLEKNLNLFIRVVESDKPGYLSRDALIQFIEKNRTDIGPDALKAMKSVFDINFLVFGEYKGYISKDNVKKLIEFTLAFNDIAAQNFAPAFQSTGRIDDALFRYRRATIDNNAKILIAQLKGLFNEERHGQIHTLDLLQLLENFTTDSNSESMAKVKKILFLKKLLVGGERNVISHIELERFINSFNNIATITLDLMKFKDIIMADDQTVAFLKTSLSSFGRIIFDPSMGDRSSEHFFDLEEAIVAVKLFLPQGKFNIDKYRTLIDEGKQILMGGTKASVYGSEFRKLVGHLEKVLFTGNAFFQIYEKFKGQLNSTRAITINFSEYRDTYPDREQELKEFSRIISKYRFFKGSEKSATYSSEFKRNPQSIFEIYLYEYAFKLVFAHSSVENGKLVPWASPSNGLGGKSMRVSEVLALVKRFEKELIEMGIILPKRANATAETVSLLGSLFQFQSDDNKVLDVNEATEFAISLFTSMGIAKELMDYYKTQSGCEIDSYKRVESGCFKKHFFKSLCTKKYRSFFPRFFESLNATDPKSCEVVMDEANTAFLQTSIRASRNCNIYPDDQTEIPYSESDMFTIFLAMMHVETTIIKWDVRGKPNNVMDPDEVMDAYPTYSTALDGFLEDMPGVVKSLKRQIFQFLIKYEEIPSEKNLWKFMKFLVGKKKAPATRKTIASILAVISEENSKKLPAAEQFDCNTLHHPDSLSPQANSSTVPVQNAQTDFWMGIENNGDYQNFVSNPLLIEE